MAVDKIAKHKTHHKFLNINHNDWVYVKYLTMNLNNQYKPYEVFHIYLVIKRFIMEENIKRWMKEWVDRTSQVKYENSFNEKSDEWIEIEGIGKFKGLEIVSEQHDELNEITINLKYDVWDKNVL